MKHTWSQIRCLAAEILLNWAVNLTPAGSVEKGAMCRAANLYLAVVRSALPQFVKQARGK